MAVGAVVVLVAVVVGLVLAVSVVAYIKVAAVAAVYVVAVRLWDVVVRYECECRNVEGRRLVAAVWARSVSVYCVEVAVYLGEPPYRVLLAVRLLVVVLWPKVVA